MGLKAPQDVRCPEKPKLDTQVLETFKKKTELEPRLEANESRDANGLFRRCCHFDSKDLGFLWVFLTHPGRVRPWTATFQWRDTGSRYHPHQLTVIA